MLLVLGRLAALRLGQDLRLASLAIGAIAKGTPESVPHHAVAVAAQALERNQGSGDIVTQAALLSLVGSASQRTSISASG
jgi:hypothetical protein